MAEQGSERVTPMMRQYVEVRRQLGPDTLLLFRLGDFYEMFDADARLGADLLGITLTQRHGQPMAGIPYHAADGYIGKLLAAGKKVAICDQMENPKPGQLVKRALTRILTPGTTVEDHQLDARRNHYLLALDCLGRELAAAWLDLSTGEFRVARDPQPHNLLSLFVSLDPREILLPETAAQRWMALPELAAFREGFGVLQTSRPITRLPDFHFDVSLGASALLEALGVHSLEGFGLERDHPGLGPAGAVLNYATESLCARPANLNRILEVRSEAALLVDPATQRNLEIFRSYTGSRQGSLLAAMDATMTAPGARLLENWLSCPLRELPEIHRRQQAVGLFLEHPSYSAELREYLRGVRDLPRVLGRLRNRLRNPRDVGAVRETLRQIPHLRGVLDLYPRQGVASFLERIRDLPELRATLEQGLAEELPSQLREGGYIASGYDAELDRLRHLRRDTQGWLASFEAEEAARTGIKNLRVKYSGAFGYFIEVTKSQLARVPDDYIRKQTTTNSERFYTPALKEKEREILGAEERALAREEELFQELAERILLDAGALEEAARALAELDVLLGWARLAREWDYCCPEVDASDILEIREGRHPVVEQMLRAERLDGRPGQHDFVPNDTSLSASGEQIALITGPNMAGKSTYIRQVALIALMAQTGAWVPARSCRLGLVDRIFSRVGASDELARGHSTFMVEMNETAFILHHATPQSLIILDEIGRGTSTYDGLSIAWAVMEHLHGEGQAGPRTLFATHYHELTQLERQLPRLRNYCVTVKEWNDQIIFVRSVRRGAADRSYGIQVARLAGLPAAVVQRAQHLLNRLEGEGNGPGAGAGKGKREQLEKVSDDQLFMF